MLRRYPWSEVLVFKIIHILMLIIRSIAFVLNEFLKLVVEDKDERATDTPPKIR